MIYSNIYIVVLLIALVIVSVLYGIDLYYKHTFQQDRINMLNIRENELNKREMQLIDKEKCNGDLIRAQSSLKMINDILVANKFNSET
jgi:hypothetical protein